MYSALTESANCKEDIGNPGFPKGCLATTPSEEMVIIVEEWWRPEMKGACDPPGYRIKFTCDKFAH